MEAFTLAYLDDILVFSKEEAQYWAEVRQVLKRFKEKEMKVKLGKSEFAQNEIQFWGHVIANGKLKVDKAKLNKLVLWTALLTMVRQVRQLMRFLSYYRMFIPYFATVTTPLTDLLRGKAKKIKWTSRAEEAITTVKRMLWDACARYTWDSKRENRVTTDASGTGLGVTLEQRVEGISWVPVVF